MQLLSHIINQISYFLWNGPIPILLLGTHFYFTVKLHFIQKKLPHGIRLSFSRQENAQNGISPYAALSTALAATIGTGNIIGISTAIAVGGPGAVFWCWLTGLLGVATCYAESFLSVKYRTKNKEGQHIGGPMYVLQYGLRSKYLSKAFALFTIFASFGIGSSVQANSIRSAIREHISVSPDIIGITAALLAGIVMLGGIRQISRVCTFLVPFMSLFYLSGCIYLLLLNHQYIPEAIRIIVQSAFSSRSVLGGIAGTAVLTGIRTGISKGLFTNEAGLGSIPMTAASSACTSPVKQGLISMTGPFWDTVVICAFTGIVIVSSILRRPDRYLNIAADRLCFTAFSELPFGGSHILSFSLILFAFATILGWCYYGECSTKYLFQERGVKVYQVTYLVFIYLGAVMPLQFIWNLSDLLNLLMAVPNLFCLWLLRNEIQRSD